MVEAAIAQAVALARTRKVGEALAVLEPFGPSLETHVRGAGLMGTLSTMANRPEAALIWFERSLALNPLQPAVLTDMGNALAKLDRPSVAIDAFDRALQVEPTYLPALNNRAGQRLDLKDAQGALEDADRALALNPQLGPALRFRARALLMLDRAGEGLQSIEAAEALQPDNPDNASIRAAIETAQGRFADAAASLDRAVALEPDNANYLQSRAYARLRLRDFTGGWADHEHRWRAPGFRANSRGPVSLDLIPRLATGVSRADLTGKRVLVVGEQGVGDQIMFGSLLPDLQADAAAVTCVTNPRMQSLFETSFPGVDNRAEIDGLRAGDFDVLLGMASLAPVYRGAATDFPGRPYLRARDEIVAGWRQRLGEKTTRLRVGVSWRGGADITQSTARSMTLETLRPLLERADCQFVNLQYGGVQAEVEAFNATLPQPILNFPREDIENFEALAGLVANLDLVVSVQTTIIHLSGAIGAPCLVMLPFIPEWRYGAEGDTMPWYSSVRLLRQPARGAWEPVIAAVGAALEGFEAGAAIAPAPDLGPLVERALTLARDGDRAAAIRALQVGGRAILDHPRATGLLAGLLLREERYEESLPYFEALNRLEPDNAAGHVDYARALIKLERKEAAVEALGRALALQPNDVAVLVQRSSLLIDLENYEAALAILDTVLRLAPPKALHIAARQLRARAGIGLLRFEAALSDANAAIALDPGKARSHSLQARALTALGRVAEAGEALERTVALDPDADAPRYLLSMHQLRQRQFAEGWRNYERRWKVSWFLTNSNAMVPAAIAPRLSLDNEPDDFDGKSVLIMAEQGIGDQIMFSSILPDLTARASKVTFVSIAKIMGLFKASFPSVDFIPPLPSLRLGAFDKVIGVGSLARPFRNRLEDFPGTPFLRPPEAVIETWKARLGPKTTRLRVGLSWKGGTDKTYGQRRSIALEQLRPLLERQDCEFVSLQYGDVEAEVAAFNATLTRPIRIFPKDEIADFEPLAGLVLGLDLVVSVQTSIIHLSGALGAPCLVMIPYVPEWRYGAEGETMPWYRSVRLIRQSKADDWTTVVERIGAELDARAKA